MTPSVLAIRTLPTALAEAGLLITFFRLPVPPRSRTLFAS